MESASFLRPDRAMIAAAILVGGAMLAVIIFSDLGIVSKEFGWICMALLFAQNAGEKAFWVRRTGNRAFVASAIAYAWAAALNVLLLLDMPDRVMIPAYIALIPMFGAVMTFHFQGRLTFRYKRVMELAARRAPDLDAGFTARPLPVGHIPVARGTLEAFAAFLGRRLVAIPRSDERGVYLVLATRELAWSYIAIGDPRRWTHVFIAWSGEVSASITEADYRRYRRSHRFEQLCMSLGTMFMEFLVSFQRGEEAAILSRLRTDEHGERVNGSAPVHQGEGS